MGVVEPMAPAWRRTGVRTGRGAAVRPWIVIGLIVVAFVPGRASASCAAPFVEVEPAVAAPGDQLHIEGEAFLAGCDDVGGGNVCSPFPDRPEPAPPMIGVRLELRRNGQVLDVVHVDADSAGRLQAELTVPEDAEAGRYVVDVVHGNFRQQRVGVDVER